MSVPAATSPEALAAEARAAYAELQKAGLKLDMTRGKPSAEQLDLAEGMLALPGNRDHFAEDGQDVRNYGGLQGLPEARRLFGAMLGVPAEQVVVAENSSLAIMHDCIVWALLKGVVGGAAPWSKADAAFICPVPGYDRHFALCEGFGIRMIPVPMRDDGPDMDAVEAAAADPAVKGMWCVPTYSNPTGATYSEAVARRLAAMRTGAPDFRLFWDNAYAVHHLTDRQPAPLDILGLCAEAGHAERAFIFASTSKITLAGAGLAFFAGSAANLALVPGTGGAAHRRAGQAEPAAPHPFPARPRWAEAPHGRRIGACWRRNSTRRSPRWSSASAGSASRAGCGRKVATSSPSRCWKAPRAVSWNWPVASASR